MISGLRQAAHYLVALALYYSGTLTLWRYWVTRKPTVVVIGLHRILTDPQVALTCSESAMIMTVQTFRRLLAMLREQFHILSFSDFVNGQIFAGSKPNCLLTFDDAWLDTFENAYPVLREAGVSAVVFVPTGLLGGETFWVERLSALWRNCGELRSLAAVLAKELDIPSTPNLETAIAALKRVPARRRNLVMDSLSTQFASAALPSEVDRFMNWEQLEAAWPVLEPASHGVNHLLLDHEERLTVLQELRQSREMLKVKTGREVDALAYPSGSFNERVRSCAAETGYRWAFTVRAGTYHVGDDPLTVSRCLLQEGNVTDLWGAFSPAMANLRLSGW